MRATTWCSLLTVQAVATAQQERVDLVILDWMLPRRAQK
jgi:DNA-binding response OmpR family regulator